MKARYSKEIDRLYLQMYSMLFEYARSSLSSDALAEEAVQDTFIIACQKPEALCESPNPEGWLVNTLKNVLSNVRTLLSLSLMLKMQRTPSSPVVNNSESSNEMAMDVIAPVWQFTDNLSPPIGRANE